MRSTLLFAAFALAIALPGMTAEAPVVAQAHAAIDANHPDVAVPLLRSALAQSPNDSHAHYLLGVAYGDLAEKANVFRQASLARHSRDEFERAVQIDPDNLDARYALVQYYTLAPGFLGGSKQKAFAEAAEIRARNAALGNRAIAFINSGGKIPSVASR
jgi:tetratricopeptide (TPR) repeat protein